MKKTKNTSPLWLFTAFTFVLGSSSFAEPAFDKKQVKAFLTNVSSGTQRSLLGRAQAFNSKYSAEKIPTIDIVTDLAKDCDLEYERTAQEVIWPQAECQYHPDVDKSLGGGSSKFLCDFPDKDKVKVRYASEKNPYEGESEVVETILASALARLVGFSAKRACPAELTCLNCPNSDPWKNKGSRKGRASSGPGKNVQFSFTAIERNLKAFHISTSTSDNAPNGVNWPSLKTVSKDLPPEEKRQMLIEREVMMLWIHFLMNPDAGHFNNRLSCPQKETQVTTDSKGNMQVTCLRPEVYVHDYGHTFYEHFQFHEYIKHPVLVSDPKGGCYGVMTKENIRSIRKNTPLLKDDSPFLLGARISAEARDELVKRLRLITDHQWRDLYLVARIEKAQRDAGKDSISIQEWISAMKKKIQSMEEAQCLPFDEGSSALGTSSK